ncbi:U-box domain-containing protein 36-like [Nicotiana tabacum]|uniref:U-box domain-containing protein 36-like n=1 Tax=Nicotiana tabacum TaxID=4097 RepID=A0A1S3XRP5_TOBAC|nr:PREDICTED: U-box domain-containing protein 54-like [Nicotiana tabacum]
MMSGEIEEIGEDGKSVTISSKLDGGKKYIYIAVGKNDLHVLQWALDNAISPGVHICLVHVFPPITYFHTPVGKLSRNQLSQEQVKVYINEENNRRKNLLEKYMCLCNDAKKGASVPIDTMLVESNSPSKALLDLISVVNITSLIVGTKRSTSTGKGQGIGDFVQKNAPDSCVVTLVCAGKRIKKDQVQQLKESCNSYSTLGYRHSKRNLFECICFSGKFD